VPQCGLNVPILPPAKAENLASCTASSATQCRSSPVSGPRLPKTGIFQISAGDYRRFRSHSGRFRSPETVSRFAQARHWRAFLSLLRAKSPVVGLVGWRRSADRTRLWADSLLTGNFTGNLAIPTTQNTIKVARNRCLAAHFSSNSLLTLTGKIFRRTGTLRRTTGNLAKKMPLPESDSKTNRLSTLTVRCCLRTNGRHKRSSTGSRLFTHKPRVATRFSVGRPLALRRTGCGLCRR
jgi:hypothetical protein